MRPFRQFRLSRRTLLRGAGAALALPWLEVMTPRSIRAAAAKPPVRLGCLYLPNGSPPEAWSPKSTAGKITALTSEMAALRPFMGDLQIITGLQSELRGSHPAAGATWLVRPAPEGDRISARRGVGGASMDQLVAKAIGSDTPFTSLELITKPEGSFGRSILRNNISWSSATTPLPRETEPRAIFNRLTGRGPAAGGPRRDDRQSILDAIAADARSLRTRVSVADRDKLDEYFEAVRAVEKRLELSSKESQARLDQRLAQATPPPAGIPEDHEAYLRLMFDMMVLAYWTDSTRVATFMLDHEQSNRYFNFLPGVKGMWHALSHWRDISGRTEDDDGKTSWTSRDVKRAQYLKVIEWHHRQVAYFFNRLKSIREGDGTLLDHSLILYGSPFADGHEHASKQLPVMLAGHANGQLQPGMHRSHQGKPLEGIYLSMMDKLGVRVEAFGGTDNALEI